MRKSEQMKALILSLKRKNKKTASIELPVEILVDAKTERVHTEKVIRKKIRLKRVGHQSS